MSWIRRAAKAPVPHACTPPIRETVYELPPGLLAVTGDDAELERLKANPVTHTTTKVDGEQGDLGWHANSARMPRRSIAS